MFIKIYMKSRNKNEFRVPENQTKLVLLNNTTGHEFSQLDASCLNQDLHCQLWPKMIEQRNR